MVLSVGRMAAAIAYQGSNWRLARDAPAGEKYLHVISLLQDYEAVTLASVGDLALNDRIDTKYVLCLTQLTLLLSSLADAYHVLEVDGVRLSHYCTLYFDTAGRHLYRTHHAGRANRWKVRSRAYVNSGLSFLEVKHRTNKGRTLKERIRTEALLTHLTPEASRLVSDLLPLDPRALRPTVWNEFLRITLVSKDRPERVTFDLDVCFEAAAERRTLGGAVVAEVKQESLDRRSEMIRQMRALGIRPTTFSKYCIGTAMLFPEVKHNRLKPVLRAVDKLMRGERDAN